VGAGRPCGLTLEARGSGLMARPINRADQGQGRPNWRGAPVGAESSAPHHQGPLKQESFKGLF